MSGRYVHVRSKASDFLVPGFVHPDELEEIKAHLPSIDLPQTLEDKLQDIEESVPRHIGQPLLQKMYKFWQEAQDVFQIAAGLLDNAHNILAHPNKFRYGNLHELAEELLSSIISKGPDGKFPAPALFAVHQSLTADDCGVRIELHGSLRSSIYYEISSIREMQNNVRVVEEVQKYRHDVLTGKQDSLLHAFAQKAGRLVDKSRKFREVTSHGTLGPSSKKSPEGSNFRIGTVSEEFNSGDEIFALFIESWTALTTFGPSSSLNGIGSTILRAVDRYQDQNLDQSTGWVFLQEIGYIPPWQTVAPYTLRVPFTGRRLRIERIGSVRGYTSDKLSAIRKSWNDLTVFCIDDVTAMEIDDGVSLERTTNPNEYWVHVHIADPASHMDPRGEAAAVARAFTENVYMQDRVVTMLSSEFVESNLSLAPRTPCLTFSAKMNLEGDILDYTVVAGRIQKVVYMTPSLFNKFGEGYSKTDRITRRVGPSFPKTGLSRPMIEEKDLSEDHILSLRTLQLLGKARSNKMKMKGAVSYSTPSPDVSVSFDGAKWMKQDKGNASRLYYGDPSIQVTVPTETNLERYNSLHNNGGVAPLMLIANEVAARWCQARGIPIPYRTTQPDPKKNPLDYFKANLLPAIQETGNAPLGDIMKYVSLIGKARPSTTPGPHMTLAADVIAKATSPLRRYGDLLLHWQVSAALLQEATTGTSLVGNTDQSFLPFSQDYLEKIIPRLDIRERAIRQCHNKSTRAWICHFLLRAWKFGEAELPSPMRFSVADMSRFGRGMGNPNVVMGQLMDFAVLVKMDCPEWEVKADLKAGDEFEVELEDVNPYSGTIVVKALRKWGGDV